MNVLIENSSKINILNNNINYNLIFSYELVTF